MHRRLRSSFVLGLLLIPSGCTFLVSFDQKGDAGCDGACSDAGMTRLDGSPRDVISTLDVAIAHDTGESADVGSCSVLNEGAPCGKPSACNDPSTCRGGVCASNPVPDGTTCGSAADGCHAPPVCTSGVCAPGAVANDGMTCGPLPATDGGVSCQMAPTCKGGTCTPVDMPDGTVCGSAPSNPCQGAPTCSNGTCAPTNLADGTACGTASVCSAAPSCLSGVCQPSGAQPDGTSASASDPNLLCCGGVAVDVTSSENCGVCGWTCAAGQTCTAFPSDGDTFYVCEGCVEDSDCWSGCCSTSPAPNHCSAGDCEGSCQDPDICPDGSSCSNTSGLIHCTY